jgi:ribosomal protein L31E
MVSGLYRKVPRRVRVQISRKRNDDEDATVRCRVQTHRGS